MPLTMNLSNRCPRCAKTPIYRSFLVMQPGCSACGYVYERENGYFLGAMVIGYFISAFSVVPTIVIGFMILKAQLAAVIGVACAQVFLLSPIVFHYARLGWIHIDYRADPQDRPKGK